MTIVDESASRSQGVFYWPHFLSREECAALRGEMDRSPLVPATAAIPESETDERSRQVTEVAVSDEMTRALFRKVSQLAPVLASHFGVEIAAGELPHFVRCDSGDFYVAHPDGSADPTDAEELQRRRLSVVVFLNDRGDAVDGTQSQAGRVYSGGLLNLYGSAANVRSGGCLSIAGEEGLLVAFPAQAWHEVSPVTAGRRYTAVTLLSGPGVDGDRRADDWRRSPFPFNVLFFDEFPGERGDLIRAVGPWCMLPPYPWGQWVYGRLLDRCLTLQGDLVEAGVGKGGTSLFLGSLARPVGKRVFSYDTFEGLPAPDPLYDNPYFRQGMYQASPSGKAHERSFSEGIQRFALEDTVVPVKGMFSDTMAELPSEQCFCFAHFDSDLYRSTFTSLEAVWDCVVEGGVVAIDDYFHHGQGPARAAQDFFRRRGLEPVYHVVFPGSVVVVKGEGPDPAMPSRSLDGSTYRFDLLRDDDCFMKVVASAVARDNSDDRAAANQRRLFELLDSEAPRSSDVHEYLRTLEDFWDRFNYRPLASTTTSSEP